MEMIKRFRNKILIINMVLISAVVLSAFYAIYFASCKNINHEIENTLMQGSALVGVMVEASVEGSDSSDGYLMFSVIADSQGNILAHSSPLNFEAGFYEKAVKTALERPNSKAFISLKDRQWRYRVVPATEIRFYENSIRNGTNDMGDAVKTAIVFLDATSYHKTLVDLMTTLLTVGGASLIAIFLISLYFSNRTMKPLLEVWQKQKQFVADASHELKTPISIINANYDLLLANSEETIQSQKKWLDYIKVGTDRMTKLTNSLLMLAKFDDPENISKALSFDLSETIQSVVLSMEAAMLEKGIQSTTSIPANITVNSDPEALTQVVSILLDNAVKYTDKNGQINIALAQSNNQVVFSVRNSGKGIPKQDLPKVFDRFYRADQSRTHENGGHGLGLSIAKAIIDALGGRIQAESVEGEYTAFTFRLNQY